MAYTTATAKSRVLIVDDQPIVRRGFAMLLSEQADLELCGEAANQQEAFLAYNQYKPHLMVVDITLKEGNGLELAKDLVACDSHAKVLMCSMHDETLYAERALRAGAKGYISKNAEPEVLLSAMRRILEGQVYLSERMRDRMLVRLAGGNTPEWKDSPMDSLSDRELEVFEEIGSGSTTREIAHKLGLSPKTIETYRENLKQKLNLQNATELTQHAVKWTLENPGIEDTQPA
jgi:DNA-binding NarL/FixJ family response regulator